MTNTLRLRFLCVAMLLGSIVASHFVSATQKQPTKRSVAVRRFHPSDTRAPVVLHDLTVGGQPRKFALIGGTAETVSKAVEPDAEFYADDNSFIEKIRFKVTNRSDKTVRFIRFIAHFFTQDGGFRTGNFDAALWIDYGHTPMPKEKPSEIPLPPHHTATIALDSVLDVSLRRLREDLTKLNADVVRVGIVINTVTFEDGSKWFYDAQTSPATKISMAAPKSVVDECARQPQNGAPRAARALRYGLQRC